ncbi:MAG: putative transport system permease protein [Gaiellaceae bacterium]|nr:putative transport system permease protein [Gaiellaceae bacterium]
MTYASLALANLLRTPGRTIVRVVVLAAAVALVGAMILFIGHSLRTMTASSVRSVPLDWQAPVASRQAAEQAARAVSKQRGVLDAVPAATAPFAGATHVKPGAGTFRSAAGSILAVPERYTQNIHTIRFLRGSLRPGEVVLDQQLAATLQAQPGDMISFTAKTGRPPVRLRVSGISVVTAGDILFQPLNPLLGPAPAQPPVEVAVMTVRTFAQKLAPQLPTVAPGGLPGIPGSVPGTQWQVQAQVDPAQLTGGPAQALRQATGLRNGIQSSLPGQVSFVDNLSESLNTATGDALYAETLYIMLALPGALIALGLAYLAALGTVERDRRELSLLRARGASRRGLVALAGIESLLVGVGAGVLGSGIALLALRLVHVGHGPLSPLRVVATVGGCVALAVLGAAAARLGAGAAALRGEVAEGRRPQRSRKPLWQKLYVDLAALAVSGLVYWLTARTGFSAVVNPDSNPTLSLSVYMFLAPAFLWLGAALLLVRLRGALLETVARRVTGGRARTLSGLLLASAGRRSAAINRGLLLVGLLLAFGVNLGIFAATYNQQARVDAQLTLGADVVASAPPQAVDAQNLQQKIAQVSGVTGTTALDHSYAYVGPDLQDTFGVNASTLTSGTTLRDSYFIGGTASHLLAQLRAHRDGILVSKETVTDYSLNIGDLLKLRLLDHATGKLRVTPFHVVGIVQEFPSAPRDSFMVTNLDYLLAATHDPGPNVVFAKTHGDASAVARRVGQVAAPAGASVKDITTQTAQTVSSITTVDMSGIAKIEEAFAVILAAAAMALFVVLGLAERKHEFATMASIGSSVREISAFLWSEVAIVLAGGLALASLLGWLLAQMLVAMLQHVFDPPPDHLAAPWLFLLTLAGAAVLGALLTAVAAGLRLRRLPLGEILREQ